MFGMVLTTLLERKAAQSRLEQMATQRAPEGIIYMLTGKIIIVPHFLHLNSWSFFLCILSSVKLELLSTPLLQSSFSYRVLMSQFLITLHYFTCSYFPECLLFYFNVFFSIEGLLTSRLLNSNIFISSKFKQLFYCFIY